MKKASSVAGIVTEKVGRGTARTEYEVAEAKPADVINRAADPATLQLYSRVVEEQLGKIALGTLFYALTVAVVGGIGLALYNADIFVPGSDIVLFSYIAAFGVLIYLGANQWSDRDESSFEKIVIPIILLLIFLMARALVNGTEDRATVLILAFGLAALNPYGFPKLWAGITSYRHKGAYDSVLYQNRKTVSIFEDALDEEDEESVMPVMNEPILVDIRQDGTPLFQPINKEPFLVRQVEDFCYLAFKPAITERGPGSGLARSNMLDKHIGPPNKTVPGRPQSNIKITRNVYDSIMAGLYAIGLVTDGPKGAAVWSKIKTGTLYESGYSIEEIRVALLRHSSKSIGKDK